MTVLLSCYTRVGPSPIPSQAQWNCPSGGPCTTTGYVGIGTASPGYLLDVNGASNSATRLAASSRIPLVVQRTDSSSNVAIQIQNTGSTWYQGLNGAGSFAIKYNDSDLGTGPSFAVTTAGRVGIGTVSPGAQLSVQGSAAASLLSVTTSSGASALFADSTGKVGIGTAAPQYALAVNGTIGAKQVLVTNTGWADFVFRPGYRLMPLADVARYIRAHHRLPDIPSESEVTRSGADVGAIQVKLLAKIEELTLHMIQAEERNHRLERANQELSQRVAALERGRR